MEFFVHFVGIEKITTGLSTGKLVIFHITQHPMMYL